MLAEVDPQFLRPGEVPFLQGNSSKIAKDLGWSQTSKIDDLISEMVDYDMKLAQLEAQVLAKL